MLVTVKDRKNGLVSQEHMCHIYTDTAITTGHFIGYKLHVLAVIYLFVCWNIVANEVKIKFS